MRATFGDGRGAAGRRNRGCGLREQAGECVPRNGEAKARRRAAPSSSPHSPLRRANPRLPPRPHNAIPTRPCQPALGGWEGSGRAAMLCVQKKKTSHGEAGAALSPPLCHVVVKAEKGVTRGRRKWRWAGCGHKGRRRWRGDERKGGSIFLSHTNHTTQFFFPPPSLPRFVLFGVCRGNSGARLAACMCFFRDAAPRPTRPPPRPNTPPYCSQARIQQASGIQGCSAGHLAPRLWRSCVVRATRARGRRARAPTHHHTRHPIPRPPAAPSLSTSPAPRTTEPLNTHLLTMPAMR